MLSRQAHIDATPAALAKIAGEWNVRDGTGGLLLLLPEAEKDALPDLQAWCRAGRVPLVGAIFPALVVDDGFAERGALAIELDPMPKHFLLDRLDAGARTPHSRICAATRDALGDSEAGDRPTLFLIFDSMVPDVASVLDSTYRELRGRVRYAGVNAGSESFQPMPCLFNDAELVGNGVLGLLLCGETVVAEHGYPVANTLMQATSTTGNRIELIDRRPAMEVYQEVIAADFGVTLTHENFYDYAVHYPFGVVSAVAVLVRIPVAFEADGTIHCVGEVPNHSMLRLIGAPGAEQSPCIAGICGALPSPPSRDWLLTFYCAGRRMHFGAAAAGELAQLRHDAGAKAVVGALSLGEISTNKELGLPEFHNAAVVCVSA